MIVIKIELHSAITGKITELGRMLISNDGTSKNPARGNYDVKLGRKDQTTEQIRNSPHKTARVEDYPRKHYPVWELVRRALRNLEK